MYHPERSQELEFIDLPPIAYSLEEYLDCMRMMKRVGRFLGGDRAGLLAFDSLEPQPDSILDVGCGAGYFAAQLAQRYPDARVVGIDTNREAIALANQHQLDNLSFQHRVHGVLSEPEKSVDVVTATLVCHHLTDEQLVDFLQRACKVARKAVILNDLHRHPLAKLAFGVVAPLMLPNRLNIHDGWVSIERGFTRQDWEYYLQKAGIPLENANITWRWAFRWVITITVS